MDDELLVPSSCVPLPNADRVKQLFVGKSIDALPTPAALVDLGKMKANITRMQKVVSDWQCLFRAHIKTHKTRQGTALQLSQSSDRSIIVSTLAEAWGVVGSGLLEEGIVDDILYGVPFSIHKVPEIIALRQAIQTRSKDADLRLLVDSIEQVEVIQRGLDRDEKSEPIFVFIKIDAGYHRAGVTVGSPLLARLVRQISRCCNTAVWGVYCHAGNSYASTTFSSATHYLTEELQCTNEAARIVGSVLEEEKAKAQDDGRSPQRHRVPLVLSVGSTPTAHAASDVPSNSLLRRLKSELHGDLEIHAGNYPFLDLQQVATGAIPTGESGAPAIERCSLTVLASVLSVYPGRGGAREAGGQEEAAAGQEAGTRRAGATVGDEALCDAGGIALSKDTGQMAGFGHVISPPHYVGWHVARVAQEHGVLAMRGGEDGVAAAAAQSGKDPRLATSTSPPLAVKMKEWSARMLQVGDKVQIVPQHACMVASAHPWLYIFDSSQGQPGQSTVIDVWTPWKGW
jgi:D-serine deaminase-like pyridoxal phosphate-dependent protein